MPDYGRLTEERLPHTLPAASPLYPPPPWKLPDAQSLKIIYETDSEPLLRWLPPRLSRSSPPYAILSVTHYPESPAGPFSLACQQIGCRAGFFIRAFTVQSVVDRPDVMAALREVWGFPCRLGEVELPAGKREATARVSSDGAALLEMALEEGSPIEPGLVRFDPLLNLRAVPSLEDGKSHELLQMVQIDPDYEVKEALRGAGMVKLLSGSPGAPFHLLPVRHVISAVLATSDTELPLARFVMPY